MSCSTGPNVYQDTTYQFSSNAEVDAFYRVRFEDRSTIQLNFFQFDKGSTIPMQNYAGTYSPTLGTIAFEGNGAVSQAITKALQNDLDHMWIGRTHSASNAAQHIGRIAYYRRQLTNDQIEALTA